MFSSTPVFVLFVVAVAVCAPQVAAWGDEDDHPAMRQVRQACKQAQPVDPEIYARAEKGDFQTDDLQLQRYITCVFETAKAMDENGEVDMTDFIKGMKPEAAAYFGPKFLTCQNTVADANKYLKSVKLYECFRDMSGDKWYFI